MLLFFIALLLSSSLSEEPIWEIKTARDARNIATIPELMQTSAVSHPNTIYKKEDLERAKRNIALHSWAKSRNSSLERSAFRLMKIFNDSFIEKFVSRTTPGSTTFCPHCYATGKNWHANGDWKWSSSDPDKITCNVCGMTFPNEKYPEILKFNSTWDPEQQISYINQGPVKCMNYGICRPSIS